MKRFRERRLLQALCLAYAVAWIVAAIDPVSRGDWLLENLLVFAVVPLLIWSYRKRPLTDGSYALITAFLLLHALGAHYTYAKVPLGDWIKDALRLERNHFDRLVHFSFGLLLTYPLVDVLRFLHPRRFWAVLLPAVAMVAWSGCYEIVEAVVCWFVAPELGQEFLGVQGDVWDGQKDMALAIVGAAIAAGITLWRGRGHRNVGGLPRLAAGIALLASLVGCGAPVQRRDWSDYAGPGAEHFQVKELAFPGADDPIEPVNRVLSMANFGFMKYVFAPTAWIYRRIVPEPVRTHVAKAGVNFQYPGRVLNNLLQAKWREAGVETARFGVNTTVGLLGLFDPASDMGLRPYPEDFGQTFAKWGWEESLYLYLPIFGPSTIRDAIGLIPDSYADVSILDWRIAPIREANRQSDEIEDDLRFVEACWDAYEPARTLSLLQREVDVANLRWNRDESGATQTLDTIFLEPQDWTFPEWGDTESVRLDEERELPYTLWLQPEPAPLTYVVPGFGGHRLGDGTLGLAEIIYRRGSSVVTLSSPTNHEFISHGSSTELPGYVPADARDLHRALTAIDADLVARFPDRFRSRRLAGISLGACQLLHIAADESNAKSRGLLAFDVYVAMNPPVDFEHSMRQLDRFYNAPMSFPPEERALRIEEIFAKVLELSHGDLDPATALPFTKLESQFLIGLAFRMDLQFVILQTQERHDRGVLLTPRSRLRRAPAFREASEYSFLEYVYAFVLPSIAGRAPGITFDEAGGRRLLEDCGLRAVAAGLVANDRIRVFTNENDFLLRPEDHAWLRAHLGDRVHVFPAGGHLGNLHRQEIEDVILRIVGAAADGR